MKRELSSSPAPVSPVIRLTATPSAEEAEEAGRHLCRIFWWGLSSNGAVTKYLQVLRGNMRISWVCACVCVRGLWSNSCHSITLPLISACELYLGAKSVTCLRAVKCRRLCWHMEEQCNGCQTSRGWADANQETGRTRARTISITITLLSTVWFGSIGSECHNKYWYNRTVKTTYMTWRIIPLLVIIQLPVSVSNKSHLNSFF